jgi:hypothetical protein
LRVHRWMSRTSLFSLAVPAFLVGFLVASQVSLAPDRPDAEVGRFDLAVDGHLWTSEPIRVDATAVALTWNGVAPMGAGVRVSDDGKSWGSWTAIHDTDGHGPDPDSHEPGTTSEVFSEAVYTGEARWFQFRVIGNPDDVAVAYVDTTGRTRNLGERLGDFIDRLEFARTDAAAAAPDQPAIRPRSDWGGDQCRAGNGGDPVEYNGGVRTMFVHHTVHAADSNGYTQAEVANLVYAICSFHVGVRGWSDIAYNTLIDQYGVVWEGRAGGLDKSVQGAHTGGFNSYSTGVAFLGDHRVVTPSPAAEQALIDYAAWKLDIHHVDPRSLVTMESLGSSKWVEGAEVTLRGLSGHRDASLTTCPGDKVQERLGQWAEQIASTGGPKIFGGWHSIDVLPGSQSTGYAPTGFPFGFSEEMSWQFVITDESGVEILRQSGIGIEGSVVWDGTFGGVPQAHGVYTAHLEATPSSGAPLPRPASFDFTLGSFEPPFSDDEGSVHEQDIGVIASLGITTGCGPERFCPGLELNRWQMALFITRMHAVAGYTLPEGVAPGFTDIGTLPVEYQLAINQLAQLGVSLGTGPNTFDPGGIVSREQMALFLVRWLGLSGMVLPSGDSQGFTDIGSLSPESQTAINQLAQLGITTGTAPGLFSPSGPVTREQMASFLVRTLVIVPNFDLASATASVIDLSTLPANI